MNNEIVYEIDDIVPADLDLIEHNSRKDEDVVVNGENNDRKPGPDDGDKLG